MCRPINFTVQPTRAVLLQEGYRLRMEARNVTVASVKCSSDEDGYYLVVHFEEPDAAPRIFNLDQLGGALIDVIISDVYESDDIGYLLAQRIGPGTPYSRGFAAGTKAAADAIGRAAWEAAEKYRQTHLHDDDVIADTLEAAERIARDTGASKG